MKKANASLLCLETVFITQLDDGTLLRTSLISQLAQSRLFTLNLWRFLKY
jgi:hypothetical protein